jgi:Arc/MetJ family transcription regulator
MVTAGRVRVEHRGIQVGRRAEHRIRSRATRGPSRDDTQVTRAGRRAGHPLSASKVTIHVVYTWCMGRTRTNIEIDDQDVGLVMQRYELRTKTEAVALALRHLAGQPMTREEALAMRGAHAIGEIPTDDGPGAQPGGRR